MATQTETFQFKPFVKSHQWYQRHSHDQFVKAASKQQWRSRAAFKLIEIADKTKLFHGARTILDLGAAPGSWSQVAISYAPNAMVIAIDILQIKPISGVITLKGDILASSTRQMINDHTEGKKVDLILSDMSVNLSGIKVVDEAGNEQLYDNLLNLVNTSLSPQGAILCKLFSGAAGDKLKGQIAKSFVNHNTFKPAASRSKSAEIYFWAKAFANR